MEDVRPIETEDGMATVEGIVERVIYTNETNGYSVCELIVGEAEEITIVGTMPYVTQGDMISATGEWVVNPKFGRQFSVGYYERKLPSTEATILKYLSAGAIKGIGPKTAKTIVARFGEDTFDVMENHPDWLAQLPGISRKKASDIAATFREQYGMRQVMAFCREFFGPATSVRIYHRYGLSAIDTIRENPYVLCDDVFGVGFERADRVAKSLGMSPVSPYRIAAAIKYLCEYNAFQNGHVYLPEDKLVDGSIQMLSIGRNEAEDGLEALVRDGRAVREKHGGTPCIYLKKYYEAEKYVCQKLDLLDRMCTVFGDEDCSRMIDRIEQREGIEYERLQRRAILSSMKNGVLVLTGGPGTGKTTVVRAILSIFKDLEYSIALAAPTGRAAKRLSEVTQNEAKTIHRLLEMEYTEEAEPRFNRDENNPIDEKIVIVDEASMIDLLLMNALLRAMRPGSKLILIGDADQLPPVGAGYVLRDLIRSERFSTVILDKIFRQAQESLIVTNAHTINAGEYPELHDNKRDFFFIMRDSDEQTAKTVVDLCHIRLPKTYGDTVRDRIQVITPSRKGAAGTVMLNVMMQQALNPPAPNKREKRIRDVIFREGDKVMQIHNNYDLRWERVTNGIRQEGVGVFNGDIGIIRQVDNGGERLIIDFDERIVEYDFALIDELEHAYAITVHKSQGSEYPVIILPVYRSSPKLMTRNLLYTAVTRAEEMVIVVGTEDEVRNMVDNNRQAKRYSALSERLSEYAT